MTGPKLSKAKRINIAADFETTTDPLDCRVWAWGYVDVSDPAYEKVVTGTAIEGFLTAISKFNANVYFHNLKFDGTFILDFILRKGFVYNPDGFSLSYGEYATVIDNGGKFYSITVRWRNGTTTQFRDSLKKIPFSVAVIAKTFSLEYVKGELDYDAYRAPGHVLTRDEDDYLRCDIIIVAQALRMKFEQGMTQLTVASDSMAEYKRLIGSRLFRTLFPVLELDIDAQIRLAYRGGWTYVAKRFRQQMLGRGMVFDVNSLYPSVMYNELLPYGEPLRCDDLPPLTEKRPLSIFQVTFTARLKPNHVPCIQIKRHNMFLETEYLETVEEPTTLWVTSVDWELWNEQYDIDVISYDGGFSFQGSYGFFDEYIDKWSRIKAESVGGLRQIAKDMMNSLYGKFAKNPDVTGKIPGLKDDRVHLSMGPDETSSPVYTAMGCFITAYARAKTIRAAQENYDVFAYADTDSLHLITDCIPDNLEVHPTKLGAWKQEYEFLDAFYIRSKAYLERKLDGTFENHIAGLPREAAEALTYDAVRDGAKFSGKLSPKVVPGGVVLVDVEYTLKF